MTSEEMFLRYRSYFESWLNIPVEDVIKAKGILITESDKRKARPAGWRLFMPVCAFTTESAFIISCIPEWTTELNSLLKDAPISDVYKKLKAFGAARAMSGNHCKFFGLEELNTKIDTTKATLLTMAHYDEYSEFYRRVHPSLASLVDPESWMRDEFRKIVDSKIHYCVFADGEIASATDSENLPNIPEKLVHIGINTVQEHRRNGYAATVCAAFVADRLKRGLFPVWHCDVDNAASESLANKLGFRYVGDEVFICSLEEV